MIYGSGCILYNVRTRNICYIDMLLQCAPVCNARTERVVACVCVVTVKVLKNIINVCVLLLSYINVCVLLRVFRFVAIFLLRKC